MIDITILQFYIAQGYSLFPCNNKDKRPLTPHGFKNSTTDISTITIWHQQYPDCAWGTPTSSSYAVVDIDPRNHGDSKWNNLIREYGELPYTPCVETGSGGRHYILQFPEGTRCGKIGEGIDLKADGGYVIVPPSRIGEPHHFQAYKWLVKPWEYPIALAPDWLLGLMNKPSEKRESVSYNLDPYTLETHQGSGKGKRRITFCQLAGKAIGLGLSLEVIWEQAHLWALRCTPPFDGSADPKDDYRIHLKGLLNRENLNNSQFPLPSPTPYPIPRKELTISPTPDPNRGVSSFPTPIPYPLNQPQNQLVSSFPTPSPLFGDGEGGMERVTDVFDCSAISFPLSPEAYHGVLGELVKAISKHTEADNLALLVCLLTAFGNAVGFNPYFDHGKRHGCNLFTGLVGDTATRKGTATAIAKTVIALADPEWEQRVQHEGFGSGEGLIWAVRDPNPVDPVGISDKRLLVIEEEWAKTFTLSASEKSILTPIIRGCYDRIPIGKRNKGDNAYGCKEPHISIIGNITPDDLRQSLTGKNAVAIANGFLNRFLLVTTRRTKFLPRGGKWKEYAEPFIAIIREAITKAKTRSLMTLDREAESVWDALYPELESRPEGVLGAVTGRASDMVMKLAMVYALADGDDAIRVCHLQAGLSVWRYCEASAFTLFGNPPSPEPDPLWLKLLNTIIKNPGVTRSELLRDFRETSSVIGDALEGLRVKGLAYPMVYQNPNGGPRGEKWYPGKGDGGEDMLNNHNQPSPLTVTDPPYPDGGKELTNSHTPTPLEETNLEGTNSPLTPDGELVSSFQGEGERGLVMVKGGVIVKQWAERYNLNPQYPEPLPQWMNLIGKCPSPPREGITRHWISKNVHLKPYGDGFQVTNYPSPEVVEWLQANWEEGLAMAKEYAELEKLFDMP